RVEQLVLRHELTGVFEQMAEDRECFRPERDDRIAAVQTFVRCLQAKRRKDDVSISAHRALTEIAPKLPRSVMTRRGGTPYCRDRANQTQTDGNCRWRST